MASRRLKERCASAASTGDSERGIARDTLWILPSRSAEKVPIAPGAWKAAGLNVASNAARGLISGLASRFPWPTHAKHEMTSASLDMSLFRRQTGLWQTTEGKLE